MVLAYDTNFKLSHLIKKIVILFIFLAVFPLIMPFFGIDVVKDCATYTISDYEIAKQNPKVTVEDKDIGECKKVADPIESETVTNTLVWTTTTIEEDPSEEYTETSGTSSLIGYFKDAYLIYNIIIVALIVIIPGYHIMRY